MLTLLHISDLHFGPPYLERVGEALQRIAPSLDPGLIVASGDFTQRAKAEQFAEARAFLDRLPDVPQVVVPGNHDVPLYRLWERLTDPYREYRRHMGSELDQVVEVEGAIVVSLNSTAPWFTVTRGHIHREQVDFVARALRDVPSGVTRIVVAHHHFAEAPDPLRDKSMLGGKRAMTRFVELGVDLVLGGHLHRGFIGNSMDFHFEGPRDRGVIVVQAGTATSRRGRGRERERNTFNLIEVHSSWLQVTHYLYFEKDDEFAPVSRHRFPRMGGRLDEHGRPVPPEDA